MHALYIHIPFCTKVCTYCDFYKMVARDSWKEKYIEYLLKEIDYRKEYLGDIKTIFIGGGTPTSLKRELLEKLLAHLSANIDMSKVVEFTIEANPDDITVELVALLKKYGINRISLGVQTLNKKKLKKLGRSHTKKTVVKAIKTIKEQGITNINADLIYGVENEKFRIVKKDIKKLIRCGVKHISPYSLIIEEKTILNKMIKENKFKVIDEEKEVKLYFKICQLLAKKKFIHYEVSNFAFDSFQSKHNLTYWNNENYLGLGAGASYYIEDTRYTNAMNLEAYYLGIDNGSLTYLEESLLTDEEQMSEQIILGLRKIEGIDINQFSEKFNKTIYEAYPFVKEKIAKGELVLEKNNLKVPTSKMYLMNEILIDFI